MAHAAVPDNLTDQFTELEVAAEGRGEHRAILPDGISKLPSKQQGGVQHEPRPIGDRITRRFGERSPDSSKHVATRIGREEALVTFPGRFYRAAFSLASGAGKATSC